MATASLDQLIGNYDGYNRPVNNITRDVYYTIKHLRQVQQ